MTKRGNESRDKPSQINQRSCDILCFKCQSLGHISSQCPNKRVMITLENGEIQSEEEDNVDMPPLEECTDEDEEILADQGQALVVLRALHAHIHEDGDEVQRENIFYTKCTVQERVCGMIIDSGSFYMVDKLALKTYKHPRSYRLLWLNESNELKVTRQVLLSFSIGKIQR